MAVNIESDSLECSSISDSNDVALHKLEAVASQNGFTIHPVPSDGNCMFSAVSYQLQTSGVCNVDNNELRQMVANYLEANAASYCDFLSQPVTSHDAYNADTEPPTAKDGYINNVADPQLQIQLRLEKYLRCLRQGAWGDHLTIQGIADMLSVKINVLSSNHPIFSVTPSSCSAVCEVFVGLIMQYRYMGLDKIQVCSFNVEQNAQNVPNFTGENSQTNAISENTTAADDTLDDATIGEGDEHRMQIPYSRKSLR